MTNREKFLAILDERIRLASTTYTHGGYVALKVQFEERFPANEIEFGPYDHKAATPEAALGIDREIVYALKSVQEFDAWMRDCINRAVDNNESLPSFSEIVEKIDNQLWPARLKMTLVVNAMEYMRVLVPRLEQQRIMKKVSEAFSGAKSNEERFAILEKIKAEKLGTKEDASGKAGNTDTKED